VFPSELLRRASARASTGGDMLECGIVAVELQIRADMLRRLRDSRPDDHAGCTAVFLRAIGEVRS
jgi:hypothetical protein